MNAPDSTFECFISRLCVRQTSVFVCEVRAFFVVSCYVCVDRQLESSVVIQGSLGGSADYEYASYASRRREGGVWQEGQGRHRRSEASVRA